MEKEAKRVELNVDDMKNVNGGVGEICGDDLKVVEEYVNPGDVCVDVRVHVDVEPSLSFKDEKENAIASTKRAAQQISLQ